MWPSYRNKQLLALAAVIMVIAVAANEGLKDLPTARIVATTEAKIPYPQVPFDIDPNAIDPNIGRSTPSPAVAAVEQSAPRPLPRPDVSAEAYLVANLDTGEIYVEHNANTVFPIASLSKLVTALVATHSMPGDQKIVITQPMLDAWGPAGKLVLGESLTVTELLYPLLLESSNDAAEAFAQSHGSADFILKMNTFVEGLGMSATAFRDVSGLSSGNTSNAKDLLKLSRYLYTNEKGLLDLTRKVTMTLASSTDHGPYTWNTNNPFPYDPNFIGGKTGRTNEAKESMISLFRYTKGLSSYPVAIIVLRSDFTNREIDTSYLFNQFMKKVEGR